MLQRLDVKITKFEWIKIEKTSFPLNYHQSSVFYSFYYGWKMGDYLHFRSNNLPRRMWFDKRQGQCIRVFILLMIKSVFLFSTCSGADKGFDGCLVNTIYYFHKPYSTSIYKQNNPYPIHSIELFSFGITILLWLRKLKGNKSWYFNLLISSSFFLSISTCILLVYSSMDFHVVNIFVDIGSW